MPLSLRRTLLVTLIFLFSISACSLRIVRAPQPGDLLTTSTSATPTQRSTQIMQQTMVAAPTTTPAVEICRTSLVRAIPVFNDNGLLTSFQTTDKFIVLTIDDGYNDKVLTQMLDILEKHDARATFFLVGRSFSKNIQPETLKRLVENGNEIAYHSHTHPSIDIIDGMTVNDWLADYQDWARDLKTVLGDELFAKGVAPYVRAPWGRWTPEFLKAASDQGFYPVYWNTDEHTFEAKRTPLKPGSILILHIIPENLDELQHLMETDWQVVNLRDALGESCK